MICLLIAAKKLPCNHIFHTSCLRSWFQRHQTCPTCRLDILRPTPVIQPSTPVPGPPASSTPVPSTAEAPAPTTASSSNNTDANNQGPSVQSQAGNINNPFYNQAQMQYQFRPFAYQQPPTSVDENNSNINDNSINSESQPNNLNESWAEFMNMPGPSFFSMQNLAIII